MREGILVEEGSPQDILRKYDTHLLEDCFLQACYNQNIHEVYIYDFYY